jgi:hypothetical protein
VNILRWNVRSNGRTHHTGVGLGLPMQTVARLGATAVAAAAIAGCSWGPPESSDKASVASTVSATSSASSSPSSAPAASRPLLDFADGSYYSFGTPSGQIQCRVLDAELICQTERRSHTVAESALCGFYPGVEQSRTRRFGYFTSRPQPCATIIQGDGFNSPHTLAYGQTVTAELSPGRIVTCTSAVDGLTCTQAGDAGPRGFFLSVDSFTVL